MGKINVLSFAVANLIAAGEVVDRPSSVIKELLENAIDSGATMITVEIQNGGITYMRVSDNGCGIEPDDLPIAIRRHATSKIKEAEDLDGILTLGFRGEALAAIAAVSDIRIISKPRAASIGAMLSASSGNILGISERAATDGTTVIVENLFANVPARRKFLKKDVTEAMAVSAVVEKIALSKPDISFKLMIDGVVKIETIGDGNVKNTIYSVFGRDFASKLIPTALDVDGITVEGFIGRSDNVRANRNYQNFFINGRYVKSRTACAAIEQAYTSYIPSEKFPCCVLFLNINPATVDVNVHPAKLEVKFSNEKPVFEAVYYAVRNALEQNATRPDIRVGDSRLNTHNAGTFRGVDAIIPIEDGKRKSLKTRQLGAELYTAPKPDVETSIASEAMVREKCINVSVASKDETHIQAEEEKASEANDARIRDEIKSYTITAEEYVKEYLKGSFDEIIREEEERDREEFGEYISADSFNDEITATSEKAVFDNADPQKTETEISEREAGGESVDYRIIGEAFNSYVIVDKGDVLLIIDKHAAHERIIFEMLKKGLKSSAVTSQLLMIPLEIMMTSDEIQTLVEYRTEIEAIGFEFTAGRYNVSVNAVPEGIDTDAVSDMLVVMAERIKSGTGSAGLTRDIVFEKALYQASCKAAVKAGREYSPEHIRWIVKKLMKLPDITFCPHGRPVAMELSKKTLDRQFERT